MVSNMSSISALSIYFFGILIGVITAFPDQGKWDYVLNMENDALYIPKSLFKGSHVYIRITDCKIEAPETDIKIKWGLKQSACWENFLRFGDGVVGNYISSVGVWTADNSTHSLVFPEEIHTCSSIILLDEHNENTLASNSITGNTDQDGLSKNVAQISIEKNTEEQMDPVRSRREDPSKVKTVLVQKEHTSTFTLDPALFTIPADGIYLLMLHISTISVPFNASVHVKLLGTYGYLSAADWPLLPFYGAMCLVYVMLGVAWLIVSFCQWRDLLRIQFWIGGVILLGMLEKATFYAEYQSINSTGISVKGAVLMAELVSCGKRMLARMLVIIVSLGFGIVKPRLGSMLHRVVGTGTLYLILAAIESYLRVMHPKNDPSNQILVASIPLAVLDSAICWWIFTSLVQTTRTLRLRRNLVKLSLYRHFTNTLIFAVVSSVVFMLYSIKFHRLASCLEDWKELWVDEAYWHLLFSVLLLVIMVLWRPTNNNQRYAFTPLLDAPEDDEDEEEQFVNDAFGVKMRGMRSSSPKPKSSNTVEDDLKWVEENIPSSLADTALPILDSDEELMTTKFEVSKMQ